MKFTKKQAAAIYFAMISSEAMEAIQSYGGFTVPYLLDNVSSADAAALLRDISDALEQDEQKEES